MGNDFAQTPERKTLGQPSSQSPSSAGRMKRPAGIAEIVDADNAGQPAQIPMKAMKTMKADAADTPEEKAWSEMGQHVRKLGALLGQLLKIKVNMKCTKITKGIRQQVIESHTAGEHLRKHLSIMVANGVQECNAREISKANKTFGKWEKTARTNVRQGNALQ